MLISRSRNIFRAHRIIDMQWPKEPCPVETAAMTSILGRNGETLIQKLAANELQIKD
jgi:hypothetical protein